MIKKIKKLSNTLGEFGLKYHSNLVLKLISKKSSLHNDLDNLFRESIKLLDESLDSKDNSKDVLNIPRVAPNQRLSPNFSLHEFRCKDENKTSVPEKYINNIRDLTKNLERIRKEVGDKPIVIISGYRTPEYNKKIGGATRSQHMHAKAADIRVNGMKSEDLKNIILDLIDKKEITQGGVGYYPSFVHYDIRGTKARW
tara:strand:- start:697 stop:1290 length:594 start_codon:yes stop_codon:yes gene_type:complete